ncbi:MAG: hypothetical protein QOJ03_2545 [Frankiaceae bacterium]|jgi:hypothetical protein|nr:hypothetical protein [Frankiaceae bacterium]
MAIVLTATAPTRELYDQVSGNIGAEIAPGLIVHTASEVDGAVRIVDIWESADDAMAFARDRLGPAIAAAGAEMSPPEITEVFDLQRP